MDCFGVADILHFQNYRFTDNGNVASHYALVLLPPSIVGYENNLYCAVITSRKDTYFSLKLEKDKYICFSRDSFVCFRRRDIESLSDLSKKKQPLGRLNRADIKKAFNILKSVLYGAGDTYMTATIIREWKNIR